MISIQRPVSFGGGACNSGTSAGQPVRERMNPFGRVFELLVQIGFAFKHQLHDHLDGGDEQAVDQPVKNAAKQAEKKPAAIRPDKTPDFAQKIGHAPPIFRRMPAESECFVARRDFILFSRDEFLDAGGEHEPAAGHCRNHGRHPGF